MPTPERHKLLFIDDELFFAQPYLEELKNDYNVMICRDVTQGEAELIKASSLEYDVAVIDGMMPVPEAWPPEDRLDARAGLMTGVIMLRRHKQLIANVLLPVVVLTNRQRVEIETEVNKLGFPDGLVEVRHKLDTPAFMLPDIVRLRIDAAKKALR